MSTDYAMRISQYDFANILFAGPCNARCPFCIGRQIDPRLSVNNLREFPPRNLDRFVELILDHAIKQVVFTGTTTDPQLYRLRGPPAGLSAPSIARRHAILASHQRTAGPAETGHIQPV